MTGVLTQTKLFLEVFYSQSKGWLFQGVMVKVEPETKKLRLSAKLFKVTKYSGQTKNFQPLTPKMPSHKTKPWKGPSPY